MLMLGEVQRVRPVREWRSKDGTRHEVREVDMVDKGDQRVTGVGLCLAFDRAADPEGFKAAGAFKVDQKVNVGVTALRFSGGEYRLTGELLKG